ncbi:hypothetical protein [Streptomyces sp. NPDC058279]|uniref:hypothetical protein n=1 Tax=Streptomyces sp. NPDC058279 TaxID=3346418 RepID=UPI0036EFED1B
MSKDIEFERDSLVAVAEALREGDRERAKQLLSRLAAEGDPEVVAEIVRQTNHTE